MNRSHDDKILSCSATGLARLIRSREVSVAEVVHASLSRIEEINPQYNAFADVYREDALSQAEMADARIRDGEDVGLLHGVPVAIKDMTPVKGKVTTLGSRIYERHVAQDDAWIVSALRRAGAIVAPDEDR